MQLNDKSRKLDSSPLFTVSQINRNWLRLNHSRNCHICKFFVVIDTVGHQSSNSQLLTSDVLLSFQLLKMIEICGSDGDHFLLFAHFQRHPVTSGNS